MITPEELIQQVFALKAEIEQYKEVNTTLKSEIERLRNEKKSLQIQVDWEKHVREVQTNNLMEKH